MNSFSLGDSADPEQKARYAEFFSRLDKFARLEEPWTVTLRWGDCTRETQSQLKRLRPGDTNINVILVSPAETHSQDGLCGTAPRLDAGSSGGAPYF